MLDAWASHDEERYTLMAQNRERGDIALDRLAEGEWRVTDRRLDEHDAPSVLGVIEQAGDEYTVLDLNGQVTQWTAQSLEEAVSLFVTTEQS